MIGSPGDPLRVLVPVVDVDDVRSIARCAAALGGGAAEVTVLDVVLVPEGRDLSAGALAAREARRRLEAATDGLGASIHAGVRIDHTLSEAVSGAAADSGSQLVLLGGSRRTMATDAMREMLDASSRGGSTAVPWNTGVLRLGAASRPRRIVVAVRGGPYAEFALHSAGSLARAWGLPVTVLHVSPADLTREARRAAERSLLAMARRHVEAEISRIVCDGMGVADAVGTATGPRDLLILGASAHVTEGIEGLDALGAVPSHLLTVARGTVLVTWTPEPVSSHVFDELAARPASLPAIDRAVERMRAVPTRVERWFAESNYHHGEFADLDRLARLKARQGLRVSLVLPALNEEATIGPIVRVAREALMERHRLVDELLVIDSASTDATREIALAEGARVVQHPDVLADHGSYRGKGEALWKSLHETTGDIVAWCDTDVRDWQPRLAYGTIGPLLTEPRLQYVKGYYQRPIVEDGVLKEGGGGRVTELVARPLINLLYPELSGFVQPLAGEYAGRRELLESIPFFTGYAVEIGHLIDIFERVGLDGLGQVDLERRVHRNQDLEGLSRMAFVIIQAVLRRLESGRRATLFAELGSRMKLPRSSAEDLLLEVIELGDAERPPMRTIPEYLERSRQRRDGRVRRAPTVARPATPRRAAPRRAAGPEPVGLAG